MTAAFPAVYRKRFLLLRNPAIRAEIASLDADLDCQRIVHLLACYEFPFDITRSLELALFHTYGSVSVSRLLDRTGEFCKFGQKRYDDTRTRAGPRAVGTINRPRPDGPRPGRLH